MFDDDVVEYDFDEQICELDVPWVDDHDEMREDNDNG